MENRMILRTSVLTGDIVSKWMLMSRVWFSL